MAERSICRTYWIRGRVQGVGFRNFVQKTAVSLGISGYAKNLDDGRVEVFAKGSAAKMELLEGELYRGPRWAEVRGVEKEEATAARATGRDFQIL
jgi:acylphosphatase